MLCYNFFTRLKIFIAPVLVVVQPGFSPYWTYFISCILKQVLCVYVCLHCSCSEDMYFFHCHCVGTVVIFGSQSQSVHTHLFILRQRCDTTRTVSHSHHADRKKTSLYAHTKQLKAIWNLLFIEYACFWMVGGNLSTRRKPKQAVGYHTDSSQRGPS